MRCMPYLKNWNGIITHKKQQFPCFIHSLSFSPLHCKLGVQITTYLRLQEQSSTEQILLNSMEKNAQEMYSLGYDTHFLLKALIHLSNSSYFWSKISYIFMQKIISENKSIGPKNKLTKEPMSSCKICSGQYGITT